MLQLKSTRLSQFGAREIDWSNPITQGFSDAILMGDQVINRNAEQINTGAVKKNGVSMLGVGVDIPNAAHKIEYLDPLFNPPSSSSFTILAVYQLRTTNGRLMGSFASTTYGQLFLPNGSNFRYGVAGGGNTIITGGAVHTRPKIDVGRYDGTSVSYFENGRLSGTATGGYNNGIRNFSIGAVDTSACLSIVPLVAFWSRALSDSEVGSISANPWQLFR
jgi:hypothetical protein